MDWLSRCVIGLVFTVASMASLRGGLARSSVGRRARFPFSPQPLRLGPRVDALFRPPFLFGPDIVQRTMVEKAKRHRPLVADLAPHRSWLRESQMMRLTGGASAYKARQGRHELQMRRVSHPFRRGKEQLRFVDCLLLPSLNVFRGSLQPPPALLIKLLEHVGIVGSVHRPEFRPDGPQTCHRRRIASPEGF